MNTILVILLIATGVMSLVSFFLMYHDKRCAIKGAWRVPEKVLFLSAILFGALGGTAGMLIFRHKTKHWYFAVFFPLLLLIQAGVIAYLAITLK